MKKEKVGEKWSRGEWITTIVLIAAALSAIAVGTVYQQGRESFQAEIDQQLKASIEQRKVEWTESVSDRLESLESKVKYTIEQLNRNTADIGKLNKPIKPVTEELTLGSEGTALYNGELYRYDPAKKQWFSFPTTSGASPKK